MKKLFLAVLPFLALSLTACGGGDDSSKSSSSGSPTDPADPSDPSDPADPSDPETTGTPIDFTTKGFFDSEAKCFIHMWGGDAEATTIQVTSSDTEIDFGSYTSFKVCRDAPSCESVTWNVDDSELCWGESADLTVESGKLVYDGYQPDTEVLLFSFSAE